eukprot:3990541-Alexandrium_andersonii.AAC.1
MAIIGLLMAPWARMIQDQCETSAPRILADDLLLSTVGFVQGGGERDHCDDHHAAVQCTIDYIEAMGSKLAPKKCLTLAS